jgi:glycosyltransferase involved in cell wall biosynthesis
MITYLLPTHNRCERLHATLHMLGSLDASIHEAVGGAEVIVIDNASEPAIKIANQLANGFQTQLIHRSTNEGASARNIAAQHARGEWIVMLDDDSYMMSLRLAPTSFCRMANARQAACRR